MLAVLSFFSHRFGKRKGCLTFYLPSIFCRVKVVIWLRLDTVSRFYIASCPRDLMPLTFVHPVAVVPFHRPLRRFGNFSALVIGSLAPDFAYVLPLSVDRLEAHSLLGLFWFCLPVGLFAYALFHFLLKGPLLDLLPAFIFRRLDVYTNRNRLSSPIEYVAVLVSLLCGATTHIIWDAFTHKDAPAVVALPILQVHLFSIGGYSVFVYKLLQHASTGIGLMLTFWWGWRWVKRTSQQTSSNLMKLTPFQRHTAVALILLIPVFVGIRTGMAVFGSSPDILALQIFTGQAVFSALPVLALTIVVYSLLWQWWAFRLRTKTG